jgi:hypothetical protein
MRQARSGGRRGEYLVLKPPQRRSRPGAGKEAKLNGKQQPSGCRNGAAGKVKLSESIIPACACMDSDLRSGVIGICKDEGSRRSLGVAAFRRGLKRTNGRNAQPRRGFPPQRSRGISFPGGPPASTPPTKSRSPPRENPILHLVNARGSEQQPQKTIAAERFPIPPQA